MDILKTVQEYSDVLVEIDQLNERLKELKEKRESFERVVLVKAFEDYPAIQGIKINGKTLQLGLNYYHSDAQERSQQILDVLKRMGRMDVVKQQFLIESKSASPEVLDFLKSHGYEPTKVSVHHQTRGKLIRDTMEQPGDIPEGFKEAFNVQCFKEVKLVNKEN